MQHPPIPLVNRAWDVHKKHLVYICLQKNVKLISIYLDKSKSKYVIMNVITDQKCQNGQFRKKGKKEQVHQKDLNAW